jgi:hypothetical protein
MGAFGFIIGFNTSSLSLVFWLEARPGRRRRRRSRRCCRQ